MTTSPTNRNNRLDGIVPAAAAALLGSATIMVAGAATAQDQPSGAAIYRQQGCYGCHDTDGSGRSGVGPALAGNQALANPEHVIDQILNGHGPMPAFAGDLSDEELAAVATYVRTSFGNDFGAIDPAQVAGLRGQGGGGDSDQTAAVQTPGQSTNQPYSLPEAGTGVDIASGVARPSELLHVPIGSVYPGTVPINPKITSPVADDPKAVQRGMTYFNRFNCVGCHAPNGAGGMGPSLSNSTFLYGSKPENIYLTILQGRPKGMPAWGGMLPDQVIWDLVAYIQSISKEPDKPWGRTTSLDAMKIEQVPAEYLHSSNPWQHTQPFSYGQAPFEEVRAPTKP